MVAALHLKVATLNVRDQVVHLKGPDVGVGDSKTKGAAGYLPLHPLSIRG